ncbi:MAG TPA: hypothetical protein VFO27_07855 [Bryobacteraceae bacterium]|nr:hypothetical protein [Bryobacteraceae bacterium]
MKARLCKAMVCVGLALGSIMGMPMTPDQIAELLNLMDQPKIVMTIPKDDDKDDPLKKLLGPNFKSG